MKIVKTVLFFFTATVVYSNSMGDTLINFADLNYNSSYEETIFRKYLEERELSVLGLFLAVNPDAKDLTENSAAERIEQLVFEVSDYLAKKSTNKEKKVIKKTFNLAHDQVLKKYELINHFDEIFKSGKYNCVSATALYAMIFDQLKIPYVIQEQPTHVSLVAYPETEHIYVETTDPTKGFQQYSEGFINHYINNLRNYKIISEEEFQNSKTDELFRKYYFGNTDVSLKELAGLQYLNDAIYKFEKQNYKGGIGQLEKAYVLYPSERIKNLYVMYGGYYLSESDYSDFSDVRTLVKLEAIAGDIVGKNSIIGEFSRIEDIYFLNRKDRQYFDSIFFYLHENLSNPELKNELAYIYYYENARMSSADGDAEVSIAMADSALKYKPGNADLQNMVMFSIVDIQSRMADLEAVSSNLEYFMQKYPFLYDNKRYIEYLLLSYLDVASREFLQNNITKGMEYLDKFEMEYEQKQRPVINQNGIGRAYGEACAAWFRKQNNLKARSVLSKGLEYCPNCQELLVRKKFLNR